MLLCRHSNELDPKFLEDQNIFCKNISNVKILSPFFRMVRTFTGFSGYASQKIIGNFRVILTLRDVENLGAVFFGKLWKKKVLN